MCNQAIEHLKKDSQKKKKKFDVTSSCILRKSFLRFVKGYPRQEYVPFWPPAHSIHYPKPNIYYAFNEDTNPFTRFQNTCKCSKNEYQAHFEPPTEPFVLRDPYFEDEARRKYLLTKPVSFVIFGKPGVSSRELAMMIADGWKCVMISPEFLVEQEIKKNTEKGRYIEKILRSNQTLSSEIIHNLIENRINMRDVKHRGYVIEGLPFIPNNPSLDHLFYPKIAELRINSIANEIDTEENDLLSTCETILTPSSSNNQDIQNSLCKRIIDTEQDIPRQIDEIFSTWPLKPSIIIYIMCPEEDLLKKYELLITNSQIFKSVDSTLSMNTIDNIQLFTEDNFYDNTNVSSTTTSDILKETKEYFSKEVEEIRKVMKNRFELYKRLAMPVIDKWVLLHNPQNVIRVDDRTSPLQMFEIVSVRLRTLPLPRLLLPKRFIERIDELGMVEGEEEEEEEEDTRQITLEEELEGMSKENAFRVMASKESVALRFPWRLSRWKFYCPVELAKGRTVEGSLKYSLRFFKNIFFLSSEKAVQLFLNNPRTFLLPPNPRPTCKIAIIGPKYSGKSKLSRELAHILKGTVVDVNVLEKIFKEDYVNNKIIETMDEMVNDVIRELRIKLEKERKKKKMKREIDLKAWYDDIVLTIQRLIEIVESENTVTPSEQYKDVRDELKSLRKKLKNNNIAHVETDYRLWEEIKKNKKILHPYAPDYLRNDEPPIRELSKHDPEVSNILQDRVKYLYDEPIEMTIDEKVNLIVKQIKNIPEEILEDEINRDGGFVIDNMYMELNVWTKILNDNNVVFENVIIIFEDEPYYHLVKNWQYFNRKYDEEFEENLFKDKEDEMYEDDQSNIELEQYIQHLDDYQSTLRNFLDNMEELNQNVILCNLESIKDITNHVVKRIKDRYDWKATVMTEEEKEEERLIEEEEMKLEETYLEGEEIMYKEEEEEIRSIKTEKILKDNRRLGDTGYYCPVVLAKYNVLWKGKEDYSAMFMDKMYLLSSERALEEFIENPLNFSIPLMKPPFLIPPLRISIIGLPGSGKSTLSNALSREYGLFHVDYIKCLEKYITSREMKDFTLKDTSIIPEEEKEELEEMDLPEDINDIRYSSNKTLIYTFIKEYIKNGGTLPKYILQECFLNYYQSPFDKCGIVLDGFPSCSQDVETILSKSTVPEVIIELKCSLEKSIERLLPMYLSYWKKKQEKDKIIEEERYKKEMNNYIRRRDEWIEKIIKEKYESFFVNEEEEIFKDESYNFSTNNNYYELSPNERIELEETWEEDNPEPVRFIDWEDIVIVRERILRRLEEIYNDNNQKIESIRNSMENETIPWIQIDGEENERKVMIRVQRYLENYVFRDISMFERTYSIDVETAERLLECGYYFLSSFGRWCPVQLYRNQIPIQMFLPLEAKNEIKPLIHRQYIYFLSGQDGESAFMKNPLKYIEQDSTIPIVPMNLSIIGPPKCGKTTLAERFAETYGLRLISLQDALKYVSNNYSWTELATKIESHYRDDVAIDNKIMSRVVEMYMINPRTISQGYVLDGFPCNREESEELAFLNIRPMIVIDLKADFKFSLECLSYVNKEINKPFDFGIDHLTRLYDQWLVDQTNYRDWLKKFSQNVYKIDASNSKWGVWTRADRIVREKLINIRRYFRESDYDKVHSLENMCVSPYEFKSYQSIYETYCPVCLLLDNKIISSRGSIDRIGVVQFREYFYWICTKHMKDFIKNPLRYIPPLNETILSKIRPRIVNETTIDLEHACWARRLQANGCCLVTYVNSLPNRNLISGKIDLAVIYDDKLYLFCSQHCQDQFITNWTKYCDVKIHYPYNIPDINVTDLPIIGYLEQTLAKRVIEAVNEVAVFRPKIPGLSAAASSAICMGVFFKIRNVSCSLKEMDIYQKINERMKARRQIVDMAIRNMKHKLNPHLRVPSYFKKEIRDVSYLSRVSTISFRRTSPTQILNDSEESS